MKAPGETVSRPSGGAARGRRRLHDVIVVAASAGGFGLIMKLAAALDPALPAGVVVVLHRGSNRSVSLLDLVQRQCRLRVIEPHDREPFEHGTLYLAPPGRHLILEGRWICPDDGPKEHFCRPAANPPFRSAAAEYGPRVLGVVLSGDDADGASGCDAILAAGGVTLAQDPREARHPSMPRRSIQMAGVTAVLPMAGIIDAIHALAAGRAIPRVPA